MQAIHGAWILKHDKIWGQFALVFPALQILGVSSRPPRDLRPWEGPLPILYTGSGVIYVTDGSLDTAFHFHTGLYQSDHVTQRTSAQTDNEFDYYDRSLKQSVDRSVLSDIRWIIMDAVVVVVVVVVVVIIRAELTAVSS